MNIGVIFAGGVGCRMHSKERPKQFLEMYNKPIIIHTLEYFQNHPMIDAIVVVCIESWIPYLKNLLYKFRIEQLRDSSIMITGATGLVGASLIRALLCANRINKLNLHILAFVRNREKAKKKFLGSLCREMIFLW